MKTKISIAAILVVTVLFLAGCQSSTAASGIPGNTGKAALLTEGEVRDIALKDAGFTLNTVENLHIEKELDDGITKFDVNFRQGSYEYEYEIDAATGKIIGFDKDLETVADTPKPDSPAPADPVATDPAPKAVDEAGAKKIALDHAGFKEADVTRLTVKKDTDDGRAHFDVEFFKGDYEYDYEIDAETGKVVDYDKEKEAVKASSTTSTTKNTTTNTISKSKAQTIALEHAKLKKSQVTGLRVSLDKDDGRTYYEVDFRKGNVEYDYEIDAVTGKVVEWDKDVDD